MDLQEVIDESKRLGEWAHVATVSPSGTPYVTPVHPCWEQETLWTLVGVDSVKVKNIQTSSLVSCHWQVSADTNFDSLIIWGNAELFTDIATKERLWDGVFDYDLNAFSPGGPTDSPDTGFMSIIPSKAIMLKGMGMGGRFEWKAQ
jgi:general stress protein 26